MKYHLFLLVIVALNWSCAVLNQPKLESADLFIIKGDTTIADEFIYVYEKNNFNNDSLYQEQDVDEYFDLFVNFKLKVQAAKSEGIDTTKSFLEEFNTYKDQLIKPYLSESKEHERLVKEAYERMKWEVDASHILISVTPEAAPEDTAKAYQQISEIYQKAKEDEDFGELAVTYSQDPSAKTNQGRLGYFTAFQMVFAFEEAAYNTPVDSISDILRSRFGYHILKVHDKRPFSGKVKVSHIMLTDQNGTKDENTIKNQIFEIYDQIAGGTDWNELCAKYSDDQRTKNNGGTLPFIGLRQINDEAFENVAFGLQNPGDISDPVRSRFGWHIIKLEEKQGLQPFEEMKDDLEQKVSKDDRSRLSKKTVIANLKQQNTFQEIEVNRNQLVSLADSSLLQGNWKTEVPDSTLNKIIFSIDDNEFTTLETSNYIKSKQRRRTGISPETYINELIDNYEESKLMEFEEQQLIANNRDFRMLLNEYYEGILLFEIMNRNVWGKAVEDTIGLRNYFEDNQENYIWGTRVEAVIFEAPNHQTIESVKDQLNDNEYQLSEITLKPGEEVVVHSGLDSLVNLYQKYKPSNITIISGKASPTSDVSLNAGSSKTEEKPDLKSELMIHFNNLNIPEEDIIEMVDESIGNNIILKLNSTSKKSLEFLYNRESALTLQVDEGLFEKGENQLVDSSAFEPGIYEFENNGSYQLVKINDKIDPLPKKLSEVKGTVISDYQNYLEKTWIEELKRTFTVEINNTTLDHIKTSFKKKLPSSH